MEKSVCSQCWVVELLRKRWVRSCVLSYQPGSCKWLLHPLIHSQNCPVSEQPSASRSFFSAKGKHKYWKHYNRHVFLCVRILNPSLVRNHCLLHQIKLTLEILSLLHWPTPLLTLTTHSTARFRACWTSSKAGTMAMLGMERVTSTLKIACWPLLLTRESLSTTSGQKKSSGKTWCEPNIFLLLSTDLMSSVDIIAYHTR